MIQKQQLKMKTSKEKNPPTIPPGLVLQSIEPFQSKNDSNLSK